LIRFRAGYIGLIEDLNRSQHNELDLVCLLDQTGQHVGLLLEIQVASLYPGNQLEHGD